MKTRLAAISILILLLTFVFAPLSRASDEASSNLKKLLSEELLLRNEVAVPKGTMDIESGITYSEKDYSDILGTDRVRTITLPFTLRYAATDRLLLWLTMPLVHNMREVPNDDTTTSENNSGIGDISLGMRYQLVQENSTLPGIMLGTSVKSKTGKTADDNVSNGPSIGTGNWQISGNMTFTRTIEPLTTFVVVGYDYNMTETRSNGNFKAGDALNLNAGFVFSLIPDLSLKVQTSFAYIFRMQEDGKEIGAIGTPASLILGLGKSIGRQWYMEPSVSVGMTKDAPDFSLSINFVRRF